MFSWSVLDYWPVISTHIRLKHNIDFQLSMFHRHHFSDSITCGLHYGPCSASFKEGEAAEKCLWSQVQIFVQHLLLQFKTIECNRKKLFSSHHIALDKLVQEFFTVSEMWKVMSFDTAKDT